MAVVLMGDKGVGKTTLLECYGCLTGCAPTPLRALGFDIAMKDQYIAGKTLKLRICKLVGQTRFRDEFSNFSNLPYYNGAVGGLLLYDVTRPATFQNLSSWVQEYWKNNGIGIMPLVILGNKVDLRDEVPNAVPPEAGQAFSEKLSEQTISHGFETRYLETSGKTGLNIPEGFETLAKAYFKLLEKNVSNTPGSVAQ